VIRHVNPSDYKFFDEIMRTSIPAFVIMLLGVGLVFSLNGCTTSDELPATEETVAPPVTKIPLRVVVLAPVSDPDSVTRQWLSDSDQPIAIQSQTVEEFLAQEKCMADVVLYPDHLLGELVARDWVVKLPEAFGPTGAQVAVGEEASGTELRPAIPRAWRVASQYEGISYAIPLGCSLPVIVASKALAVQVEGTTTSLEALQASIANSNIEQVVVPESEINHSAIVDRFLTLVSSLTTQNKKYGVLFRLNTMQPRLNEAEFVQAAEVLKKLTQQPGGLAANLGSHELSWTWAATHAQPVFTIASSTLIGPVASKIESGAIIDVAGFSLVNTGGGLQASIASSCQQTQQSLAFMKWLELRQTRALLAPMVNGIDIPTPGGVESLASRSRRNLSEAIRSDDLFQEPRLPMAHEFRESLGRHLANYLLGKQDVDAALAAANASWTAIQDSAKQSTGQSPTYEERKLEYQRSLGLTN
jgi:hypothetical protein